MKFFIKILSVFIVLCFLVCNLTTYQVAAHELDEPIPPEIKWNNDNSLLSLANEYNLFAFGDVDGLTHVEGAVAIGGNYKGYYNGLSMATHIKNVVTDEDFTFIIGGYLDALNWVMSVNAGKIAYPHNQEPNIQQYLKDKSIGLSEEVLNQFFDNAYEYLKISSNYLANLETNANYIINNNDIILDCGNQDIAIFNLDFDNDSNLNQKIFDSYNVQNVNNACIINIKSSNDLTIHNFNNSWSNKTLLNIIDAPKVDLSYSGTHCNILAIDSDIYGTNGYIHGNLVCNNLYSGGSYELHYNKLDINLIPETTETTTVTSEETTITTIPTTLEETTTTIIEETTTTTIPTTIEKTTTTVTESTTIPTTIEETTVTTESTTIPTTVNTTKEISTTTSIINTENTTIPTKIKTTTVSTQPKTTTNSTTTTTKNQTSTTSTTKTTITSKYIDTTTETITTTAIPTTTITTKVQENNSNIKGAVEENYTTTAKENIQITPATTFKNYVVTTSTTTTQPMTRVLGDTDRIIVTAAETIPNTGDFDTNIKICSIIFISSIVLLLAYTKKKY